MNTKNIITKLLKPMVLGFIVITTIISCNEIIQVFLCKWEETYYSGTGHGNQVILDNGSVHRNMVTLDNFTKDAFDIRERFEAPKSSYRLYYWLSFNYLTVSTNCLEVNNDMVVFPNSISSPKWWPDALKMSFFSRGRSKYKFYRCSAVDVAGDFSSFRYFAIDNTTKKGYYWKTTSDFITGNSMRKYYYEWENYK